MLLSSLTVTVLLAGGTPAHPASRDLATADSLHFDTTQVVVTDADFAKLEKFLDETKAEWGQPAMQQLMQRHVISYPLALGDVGTGVTIPPQFKPGAAISIPDYSAIADSTPSVAKGLADAKLTGRRYLQLSRTLNNAFITDQLDRLSHGGTPQVKDTKTVIGKNVEYIRAHQEQFQKLVQLALDVTPLQQGGGGGGGGDDLDP